MTLPWNELRVEVHSFLHTKERTGWSIVRRGNPYAALWYVMRGTIQFEADGQTYTFPPGSILLIPPKLVFQAQLSKTTAYTRISVLRFYLRQQSLDWLRLYRLPLLLENVPTLEQHRLWLAAIQLRRTREADAAAVFRMTGLAYLILSPLLARSSHRMEPRQDLRKKQSREVMRVEQWMREQLHRSLSLTDLATFASVTPEHLIHQFNQVVQAPPMQYLQKLRIGRAKELLAETDASIQEIASQVGFEDPLYFSRRFKKEEGISPSQYRLLLYQL
jgi:AraC-like DNA-binding protein